jgi:hypothetical protein
MSKSKTIAGPPMAYAMGAEARLAGASLMDCCDRRVALQAEDDLIADLQLRLANERRQGGRVRL